MAETTTGGVWRLAGCADYYSKYEFGWHTSRSSTAADAITAVELAIAEAERLTKRTLLEQQTDPDTGEVRPITLVTDIQAWWGLEGPQIVRPVV